MSKPLKVAVVGTNIGCTLHVRAFRAAGWEVSALVGRNAEQTAARAAHFSIPRALTSVAEAIDSDVDAIVVATPPATHHAIAMEAFAAGKHVLCEKPLALDVGQAKEMRDAAAAGNLVNMVVHEYRFYSPNALLRHLLRDGRLGAPIQVAAQFDHSLCAATPIDVPDWWVKADTAGGWLRNYNSHGIDLIRYMVGEFGAVCGTTHIGTDRGMTADDSYASAFMLTNGAQGTMTGSARAQDFHVLTRVIGADATATLTWGELKILDSAGTHSPDIPEALRQQLLGGGPQINGPLESIPDMGDSAYVQTHATDHGFAEQVALCSAFGARIRDRNYSNPAMATFDDGVAHMAVIEAVERSRALRRWIDLA